MPKRKSEYKKMWKMQKGTTRARTQVPQVTGARFYHWGDYTSVYINQAINTYGKIFLRPTSSSTSRPARSSVTQINLNKNENCKHETCSKFPQDSRNVKHKTIDQRQTWISMALIWTLKFLENLNLKFSKLMQN